MTMLYKHLFYLALSGSYFGKSAILTLLHKNSQIFRIDRKKEGYNIWQRPKLVVFFSQSTHQMGQEGTKYSVIV